MSPADWAALAPLMILAAAPVAIMMVLAVKRSYGITFGLALGAIGLALLSLLVVPSSLSDRGGPLFSVDGYARFFTVLILLAGLATVLLSFGYLKIRGGNREEFAVLLLTALTGAVLLVNAAHLAALFLGLEILSVSLYALIAYERVKAAGLEAGIKYLILAAFSSAFLVFGMALLYADLGTMEFSRMAAKIAAGGNLPILFAGVLFVTIGIGFKLAVVPFHMWVADVYEGAPAPVTAFIATVSKGAAAAVFLRFFLQMALPQENPAAAFLAAIAVASMVAGNLLALRQDNVKRLLAYSSIAHMGYLLVAVLAGGPLGVPAGAFYLVAYFITTLGAFGVVTVLSGGERDADRLDDYRGLYSRRPWLTGVFTAMLLSLAGIPLTAGFIGKFIVLAAGVGNFLRVLVGTLVITSAIGLFYYLRVIGAMYASAPTAARLTAPAMPAGALVLAILTVLLLWLGIYPGPLLEAIPAFGP